MSQNKMVRVSLGLDDLRKLKLDAVRERSYYARVSIALALRLLQSQGTHLNSFSVLDELDFLEGLSPVSATKPASQFKKPPLYPLWHKHFFCAYHVIRNIGIRWNMTGNGQGNKDLDKMIHSVMEEFGDHPEQWQSQFAHRLAIEGFEQRADRGLTGDWIIYAKHEGQNYYLDLATHEEGHDPAMLIQKLRYGCEAEFPFAFEHIGQSTT